MQTTPSRPIASASLVWLLAGLAWTPTARGDDSVSLCIDGSDRGQVLRDQGRLLEARESFVACASDRCPGAIRQDCATWLGDVDARIPTVVLRPRDERGRDLVHVRVFDGNRLLTERVDGRAIAMDPGVHELRFVREGAADVSVRLVAREGEKQRVVDAVWKMAPEPRRPVPATTKASAAPSAMPASVWVLGGVGLLGLGGFTYFGWTAKSEVDDMRDTCAPYCEPDRVDRARTRATIANVSLGAGALALGAAAYLAISHGPPKSQPMTSGKQPGVSITAGWSDSRVSAGLTGAF